VPAPIDRILTLRVIATEAPDMHISFIGAAQEVTGSCFLVETGDLRFLVDCGMFQGGREERARNFVAWPFDPRQIDFVLLTHAHIDHSGLLPRLCALGFKGRIHTTTATRRPVVGDAARQRVHPGIGLDAKRATQASRARQATQAPRTPRAELLYTVAQEAQDLLSARSTAASSMTSLSSRSLRPGVRCRSETPGTSSGRRSWRSRMRHDGRTGTRKLVAFGRPRPAGPADRARCRNADRAGRRAGGRVDPTAIAPASRPVAATLIELEQVAVVEDTLRRRNGNVIVPAFAVGPHPGAAVSLLAELARAGTPATEMQVYVDSPMADGSDARSPRRHPELSSTRKHGRIESWRRKAPPERPRRGAVRRRAPRSRWP
jgi:metallo-beta-lactamase family protein